MIADMIREWENGAYCVLGIKRTSEENSLMFWLRKQYYRLAERLSSIETIQNFTGFGLYDRKVVELVRSFDDPYPYFRGMIADIGLPTVKLLYDQPARKFGITKNNWYTLYDIGMLGIINHSKVPLRLATFAGFIGGWNFVPHRPDLPRSQARVLVDIQLWSCTDADRCIFHIVPSATFSRCDGRIYWSDLHSGPEASVCRGAGSRQLRISPGASQSGRANRPRGHSRQVVENTLGDHHQRPRKEATQPIRRHNDSRPP